VTAAAVLVVLAAADCPRAEAQPGSLGQPDPFRRASPEVYSLNRRGRDLYQTGRFEEAREQYRAASKADPEFLGPLLNIACSYARQGRFGDAVREALALAEAGYVPWAREIVEAADLAPLHARPEMNKLREGLAGAAAAWGRPLPDSVLFVARTQLPVRLPGEGVLHLGLNQEIFAWFPATGGYRQVTAENGRVLAFARSPDRRRVVYARASQLVRARGQPARLRGVTLRMLDLTTMALAPPVAVPGDLKALTLRFPSPQAAVVTVVREAPEMFAFDGAGLTPHGGPVAPRSLAVVLDGGGVASAAPSVSAVTGCRFAAADVSLAGGVPAVRIQPRPGKAFTLKGPWGAGLFGLPFPK
jgi:hypothetical protein